MGHTEGPWASQDGAVWQTPRECQRSQRIAVVDHARDGALIAAAPELLDALKSCEGLAERDAIRWSGTEFSAGADARLAGIRIAIAKATGEYDEGSV